MLFTTGELVGVAVLLAGEPDQVEHFGYDRTDHVPRTAGDVHGEGDVARGGPVRKQPEVLEDTADLAAQQRYPTVGDARNVTACELDHPGGGPLLPQQQTQQSGLSRAGRADQEDELPRSDLEVDVVQGGPRAAVVTLGNGYHTYHRGCPRLPRIRGCTAAPAPGFGHAGSPTTGEAISRARRLHHRARPFTQSHDRMSFKQKASI